VAYARIFRALADGGNDRLRRLLDVAALDRVIALGRNAITVAIGFSDEVRNAELGGFKACVPSAE
jgi:hypothetical protein